MGWGIERIAGAWVTLMERLGYGERFVAQGGDWGAAVTGKLSALRPPGCVGVHFNTAMFSPPEGSQDAPSPEEKATFALMKHYQEDESGYSIEQNTRPQTIGYSLCDSPVGLAAWIYEKFHGWTENSGAPEGVFKRDEMLDNIMLYWLPNAGASAARIYWESYEDAGIDDPTDIPAGVSVFPKDINQAPRSWAEPVLRQIVHWNKVEHGGHFGAFEQPELFVREVRDCFRKVR